MMALSFREFTNLLNKGSLPGAFSLLLESPLTDTGS